MAIRQLVQPGQGSDDDSGLNAIQVKCRNLDLDILEYEFTVSGVSLSGASWGEWSGECPLGTAVAGIQTVYEPYQGEFSDDTAVGGVKMFCGGF